MVNCQLSIVNGGLGGFEFLGMGIVFVRALPFCFLLCLCFFRVAGNGNGRFGSYVVFAFYV